MPRGGARPGAGRKPKAVAPPAAPLVGSDGFKTDAAPPEWPFGMERPPEPPQPTDDAELSPLDYLLKVMRNPSASESQRMQAAIQAAPYCHAKRADAPKKDAKAEAAKKAVRGRFAPAPAPLKLVAGR
jgi:hypothetical protein